MLNVQRESRIRVYDESLIYLSFSCRLHCLHIIGAGSGSFSDLPSADVAGALLVQLFFISLAL